MKLPPHNVSQPGHTPSATDSVDIHHVNNQHAAIDSQVSPKKNSLDKHTDSTRHTHLQAPPRQPRPWSRARHVCSAVLSCTMHCSCTIKKIGCMLYSQIGFYAFKNTSEGSQDNNRLLGADRSCERRRCSSNHGGARIWWEDLQHYDEASQEGPRKGVYGCGCVPDCLCVRRLCVELDLDTILLPAYNLDIPTLSALFPQTIHVPP